MTAARLKVADSGHLTCPICLAPALIDDRTVDGLLLCRNCLCEGNLKLFMLAARAIEAAEATKR